MKENIVGEIVKERIKENKELFDKKEYSMLEENINLAKKMYILGFINAKRINGKNLQWKLSTFYLQIFQ